MSASNGGSGFFGALGLLFIGLRLGHAIAWSWWWVLAPLWIPTVLAVVLLGVVLVFDPRTKARRRW